MKTILLSGIILASAFAQAKPECKLSYINKPAGQSFVNRQLDLEKVGKNYMVDGPLAGTDLQLAISVNEDVSIGMIQIESPEGKLHAGGGKDELSSLTTSVEFPSGSVIYIRCSPEKK
jgi:hypothetical protein